MVVDRSGEAIGEECLVCPECGVLEGLGDAKRVHCPKCGCCDTCGMIPVTDWGGETVAVAGNVRSRPCPECGRLDLPPEYDPVQEEVAAFRTSCGGTGRGTEGRAELLARLHRGRTLLHLLTRVHETPPNLAKSLSHSDNESDRQKSPKRLFPYGIIGYADQYT